MTLRTAAEPAPFLPGFANAAIGVFAALVADAALPPCALAMAERLEEWSRLDDVGLARVGRDLQLTCPSAPADELRRFFAGLATVEPPLRHALLRMCASRLRQAGESQARSAGPAM